MCDGDVHVFHYRPSLFNDEDLQNRFEQRFNTPLIVPETWEQYNCTAQFFTEELQDQGSSGRSSKGHAPSALRSGSTSRAAWRQVLQRRYGTDDQYAGGGAGSETWMEQKQWSPPGTENFGGDQIIGNWQQGIVAMTPWWIDLREFSARGQRAGRTRRQ